MALSDSRLRPLPCCSVEAVTLATNGSPPLPASPFRRAVPKYPGGSNGCACRLLPRPWCLPRFAGGSASASSLSRPAQASLALRPIGSLSRPRRPLSRGFDPISYPTEPLVSYQINRQFSGWNPPPLVTHASSGHTAKSGDPVRTTGRIPHCAFKASPPRHAVPLHADYKKAPLRLKRGFFGDRPGFAKSEPGLRAVARLSHSSRKPGPQAPDRRDHAACAILPLKVSPS
jgi:hypothetical protein